MKPVVSVDNMRRSDAAVIASGISGEELMERAGDALFRAVSWEGPAAVVCGTGNNAGDGYVLALRLQEAGIPCRLLLKERRASADGAVWLARCEAAGVPTLLWQDVPSLSGFRMIADCIFGTGFRGPVTGPAREMIRKINESGARVISADLNSGLNGDTGLSDLAVRSDLTVSVGMLKPGHLLNAAGDWMRSRVNADIGIPPLDRPAWLLEAGDLAPLFPPRRHFSNKGTYGTVALIGGSEPYSGAIRLAAAAALRGGAGVVRVCAPRCICGWIAPSLLESTLFPLSCRDGGLVFREEEFEALLRGVRTAAFGMGAGVSEETARALIWLLSHFTGTLVIDADGLNVLSALNPDLLRQAACRVVLTPHTGEFARLTGLTVPEVQSGGIPLAGEYAASRGVTLLLKGPATIVTDGRETLLVDRGCPGMASAGSGDVLSGLLAALLASVPSPVPGWEPFAFPLTVTAAAAWINGRAGELAQAAAGDLCQTASDTVRAFPAVFREIRETPEGRAPGESGVSVSEKI